MSRFKTTSNRAQADAKMSAAVKLGLTAAIMIAHGDAIIRTPVDTGLLRASLAWAVSGRKSHRGTANGRDGKTAVVEYEVSAPTGVARLGTNVEYGPEVHEDLNTPRVVGGPKFVETPMRERQDVYKRMLADAIKDGMR